MDNVWRLMTITHMLAEEMLTRTRNSEIEVYMADLGDLQLFVKQVVKTYLRQDVVVTEDIEAVPV